MVSDSLKEAPDLGGRADRCLWSCGNVPRGCVDLTSCRGTPLGYVDFVSWVKLLFSLSFLFALGYRQMPTSNVLCLSKWKSAYTQNQHSRSPGRAPSRGVNAGQHCLGRTFCSQGGSVIFLTFSSRLFSFSVTVILPFVLACLFAFVALLYTIRPCLWGFARFLPFFARRFLNCTFLGSFCTFFERSLPYRKEKNAFQAFFCGKNLKKQSDYGIMKRAIENKRKRFLFQGGRP